MAKQLIKRGDLVILPELNMVPGIILNVGTKSFTIGLGDGREGTFPRDILLSGVRISDTPDAAVANFSAYLRD